MKKVILRSIIFGMALLSILLILPASGDRIVKINDSNATLVTQAAQIWINSNGDFSF